MTADELLEEGLGCVGGWTFERMLARLEADGFGHWLAGFIDGEGSFVIAIHPPATYHCKMSVKLRDDDGAVLIECQERTGLGRVFPERDYSRSRGRDNAKPQMVWAISDKLGCRQLVQVLDRFPLRAKKRRDFLTWRAAVEVWSAIPRTGGDWSPMEALKRQLADERRYQPPHEVRRSRGDSTAVELVEAWVAGDR